QARTSGSTVGSNAPPVRNRHAKTFPRSSEVSAPIGTSQPGAARFNRSSGPPSLHVERSLSIRSTSRTAASLASSAEEREPASTDPESHVPMSASLRSALAAGSAATAAAAPQIRQRLSLIGRALRPRGGGVMRSARQNRPQGGRSGCPSCRAAPLGRGPAAATDAAKLVAVGDREEPVALADLVLEVLDPRLVELDHAAAVRADQVGGGPPG